MNTFLMLVTAIVVGQFIAGVIGVTLVFNKAFAKWYTKKVRKYIDAVTEEMVELIEKEEL